MSAITIQKKQTASFNIENVQIFVAESTKSVVQKLVQAVIQGVREELTFPKLAERHINAKLDKELCETDEKTKRVYNKLYAATEEFIQSHSQEVLVPTFYMIDNISGKPDTSKHLLGSFVFSETQELVIKLQDKEPGSLTNEKIWE